jgi:hypothetical protein
MADTKSGLPEGTDTIIEGGGIGGSSGGTGRSGTASATNTTSTATNSTGARTGTTDSSDATDALITTRGSDTGSSGSSGNERQGVRGMISSAGTKLKDEGKNRARGLVSQGLERGSSTLSNISTLVDDTVQQIEERLGPQYGDYARSASQTLNRYANTLQNKDADELVDDAREMIRKSPGVALAGAAIVGFGLVRLLKAGLEESQNGQGDRSGDRTGTNR